MKWITISQRNPDKHYFFYASSDSLFHCDEGEIPPFKATHALEFEFPELPNKCQTVNNENHRITDSDWVRTKSAMDFHEAHLKEDPTRKLQMQMDLIIWFLRKKYE